MRVSLITLLLLAAAPALADDEPVFVLDLRAQDVDASLAQTITGIVTVMASNTPGVRVLSGSDVQELVQLEAERQSAGCDDDASCMAEIAGALGARKVIAGEVGTLGRLLVVTLSLYDTGEARALKRVTAQAAGLEDLPRALQPALDELLRGEANSELPLVVAGVGGGAAALGVIVAALGSVPWIAYQSGRGALDREGQSFEARPSEAGVLKLANLNEQVEQDRAAWNDVGAPMFAIGLAVATAGAIVAGVGGAFAWAGE